MIAYWGSNHRQGVITSAIDMKRNDDACLLLSI